MAVVRSFLPPYYPFAGRNAVSGVSGDEDTVWCPWSLLPFNHCFDHLVRRRKRIRPWAVSIEALSVVSVGVDSHLYRRFYCPFKRSNVQVTGHFRMTGHYMIHPPTFVANDNPASIILDFEKDRTPGQSCRLRRMYACSSPVSLSDDALALQFRRPDGESRASERGAAWGRCGADTARLGRSRRDAPPFESAIRAQGGSR